MSRSEVVESKTFCTLEELKTWINSLSEDPHTVYTTGGYHRVNLIREELEDGSAVFDIGFEMNPKLTVVLNEDGEKTSFEASESEILERKHHGNSDQEFCMYVDGKCVSRERGWREV